MPLLVYTKDNIPTPTEFRADLDEATEMANPVDDLILLANRLWKFEQEHGLLSAEFYELFQKGVLNEELQHCFSWYTTYNVFLKEKHLIEATLIRAALKATAKVEESQHSENLTREDF